MSRLILPAKSALNVAPETCARPLIFEYTDDEGQAYAVSGTGFFCLIDEELLFVTARHAVSSGHEALRVPVYRNLCEVVPLKKRMDVIAVDGEQSEFLDLTFFTLNASFTQEYHLRADAVQPLRLATFAQMLSAWEVANLPLNEVPLMAYGFPKDRTDVCEELSTTLCNGRMKFTGTSIANGCYQTSWDTSSVSHPDGMSGSPVFISGNWLEKEKPPTHVFVGMMTRCSNGIGHFMSADVLVNLARDALSGKTSSHVQVPQSR